MSDQAHWQRVYTSRPADRLGWYTPRLATSLEWIAELALAPQAPVIDVGGGASTLVDDLLERGHRDVTVLDLSARALDLSRQRLGRRAAGVTWIEGDVLQVTLPPVRFALWHDRAVFHFLLRPEEQALYRERLLEALAPGGHVILATFGPAAPPRCSGLPVARYDAARLAAFLGEAFAIERERTEVHRTPSGVEQQYVYCRFRLAG